MPHNTTMSTNTKPPKLEQQIRDACRTRHYALATERAYVAWYKRFVRWAGLKHPATLGGDASTNKMHPECLEMHQAEATKYGDHEWEYSPYSHERPKVEA